MFLHFDISGMFWYQSIRFHELVLKLQETPVIISGSLADPKSRYIDTRNPQTVHPITHEWPVLTTHGPLIHNPWVG